MCHMHSETEIYVYGFTRFSCLGFHLVALDMPGHGLSSHRPPGVNYHFVDYVTDVKRVVDGMLD